jgi:hypothetical protein
VADKMTGWLAGWLVDGGEVLRETRNAPSLVWADMGFEEFKIKLLLLVQCTWYAGRQKRAI